ncbi:MAG: ABC transporter permease [Euryarchaeota archaeon]
MIGERELLGALFPPLFFLLIVFPLVALVLNLTPQGLAQAFSDPYFWSATLNTVLCAVAAATLGVALAVGFGYYHLFKRDSVIYRIADFLNDLPIALPHTVAGLALLLAFGRRYLWWLGENGLAFTLTAVVLAMLFVSYPLTARAVQAGLEEVGRDLVEVARTLGDTPERAYTRVVVPALRETLLGGFLLGFSRSLSEFAAVIMFGGNLPGKTQVLASYVFTRVEAGDLEAAVAASVFCMALSLLLVALVRSLTGAGGAPRAQG